MLKWIRWMLLGALALLASVALTGIAYEQWSRRQVLRDFPPEGRLIEYEGRLSHLACAGAGSPTVVLEGGLSVGGSRDWAEVQPRVAAWTRVCSYDRAGTLWSEPRRGPRDAERIARELHGLLGAASESPPYVLVGQSLGGLLIRVYTDRYPDEVAGIVLVDSSHPEQFERYPAEVLDFVAEAESSLPSPLVARLWAMSGGYRLSLGPPDDAIGAYLPRTVPWGFLGERAARDAMSAQVAATGSFGDRPLVVLSAGQVPRYFGVSAAALDEFHRTWSSLQAELASLSSHSVHRTVTGASHNIHVDDPDAVSAAIIEVVAAVRARAAGTEPPERR